MDGMPRAATTIAVAVVASSSDITFGLVSWMYAERTPV